MEERLQQERDRIQSALLDSTTTTQQYQQLYAAQQALAWAQNPQIARSPFDTVMLPPITTIGPDWNTLPS